MEFLVTWAIDIDAENPEMAAVLAWMIQRDHESEATYFEVSRGGQTWLVDAREVEALGAADEQRQDGEE